ncbi:hypothetical protein ACOTHJ_15420 [Achromobacter xylosoxidans]
MTQTSITPVETLVLFAVTALWNPDNDEEGTYSESYWARSSEEAERMLLEEMAEHRDSGCETDEDRKSFVEYRLRNNCTEVVDVRLQLDSDLRKLLAGPSQEFSAAAQASYDVIQAELAKHAVT